MMTVSYSGGFVRLLLRWKGSIWKSVWKELFVFLVLFYGCRTFYKEAIPRLDPTGEKEFKRLFEAICREFDEYTKLIPLTFLLGFYVSNVVSRWWRQFECLSWPEDLLSILCLVLPNESSRHIRHQIARYLNLAAALAWRDVSSKIRLRYPELPNLVDAGLMTPTELNRLLRATISSPSAMWLAPIHWTQQLISSEISAGQAQSLFLSPLANELRHFRVSFRRLFCHDWVCVPLVYTQVATLATYSYFFFCVLGRQFLDGSVDMVIPAFTIVQFLFFVGWFKVGLDLMRPFGLDDDDIELAYILDRNLVTSFTIVDRLETEPPPSFEPDVFWAHCEAGSEGKTDNSDLLWGRIDLTRASHKHPPKLHAHLDLGEPPLLNDNRFVIW